MNTPPPISVLAPALELRGSCFQFAEVAESSDIILFNSPPSSGRPKKQDRY